MSSFNTNKVLILVLEITTPLLLLLCCLCYADDRNGPRGSLCDPTAVADSTWTTNLNSLFISLATNVNPNNGYYRTEVGRNSDKIYGLVQCRGDISQSNCLNCTQESFTLASNNCKGSKSATIWQKWCYLQYSNTSFYGDWGVMSSLTSNGTSLDDPNVVSKGMAMMAELVGKTPKEKLLFATSEVDVGNGGKRYGMAQCIRDLGEKECEECLDSVLTNVERGNENRRDWEIYSIGCSLLYDYSRFYFNYSTPSPANDANRASTGRFGIGMAILLVGVASL